MEKMVEDCQGADDTTNNALYHLLKDNGFDCAQYSTIQGDIESGKMRMDRILECDESDLKKLLDQHKVVDIMDRKGFIVAIKSLNEWKAKHEPKPARMHMCKILFYN